MSDKPDESIFADPEDELPNQKAKQRGHLSALPGPYVRVPLQWICKQRRGNYLFGAEVRLFLYALYCSYWGQRGVPLTQAFRDEINVSRDGAYKIVERLESQGWLRVERCPGHAMVVWPVVITG
jgi:hypothetical protein